MTEARPYNTDVTALNMDLEDALNQLAEYGIIMRDIATRCIYRVNGVACDPECRGRAICGRGET